MPLNHHVFLKIRVPAHHLQEDALLLSLDRFCEVPVAAREIRMIQTSRFFIFGSFFTVYGAILEVESLTR